MKRRTFLKLGCASSSLALLPTNIFANSTKNSILKNAQVNTAAHWGVLQLSVKNGKLVDSKPYYKNKRYNDLQYYTQDLIYKNRIKYPYVRKSFLKNPNDNKPELRGKDEWVRVSWEDALKLVSKQLLKTRKTHGANGIFAGSYGWKSPGNIHNSRTLLHRFMNLTGGFVGSLGDYSTGASQVIMPHVVGSIEVYEQQTNYELVLENTKLLVIWGANPIDTLKIAWTVSDEQGLDYMQKIKDSNIKVICIDPYASTTVKFFDKAQHIRPRPNTDTAIMLAMMTYLYENNLYDKEFIENYTVGFEKFLPYLLGKNDGIKKDITWASKISGVDEQTLIELTKSLKNNLSLIMSGWGMQRAHHGEQPHWAMVTLCAMLGHIGKAGGGFGLSYHYSNGGVATTNAPVVGGVNANLVGKWSNDEFLGIMGAKFDSNGHLIQGDEDESIKNTGQSWLAKTSDAAIPVARIADMLLNPNKTIEHNGKKITYSDIDFIYWVGGNPFVHHQDLKALRKAWQKPSTIVMNEIYWTPSAKMADIVLPVTSLYERDDISMSGDYSNYSIVPMKPAVNKYEESKDDIEIFYELLKYYAFYFSTQNNKDENYAATLAKKLQNAYLDNAKNSFELVEKYYSQALARTSLELPNFQAFWQENKALEFEATQDSFEFVRFADFIDDPILNPLGTPSGLIEIYSTTIEKMNYDDCKAHPMWFEPIEYLANTSNPSSFHLLSPHPSHRLHSQLCHTSLKDTYTIKGHEPCLMNPEDAKELNIKDGDLIELSNERGSVIAGAKLDEGVLNKVVVLAEGAWYDPDENGNCKYGCPNVLTLDLPTSKLANGNISHTALVNVKKYTGKKVKITAFTPPKGAK